MYMYIKMDPRDPNAQWKTDPMVPYPLEFTDFEYRTGWLAKVITPLINETLTVRNKALVLGSITKEILRLGEIIVGGTPKDNDPRFFEPPALVSYKTGEKTIIKALNQRYLIAGEWDKYLDELFKSGKLIEPEFPRIQAVPYIPEGSRYRVLEKGDQYIQIIEDEPPKEKPPLPKYKMEYPISPSLTREEVRAIQEARSSEARKLVPPIPKIRKTRKTYTRRYNNPLRDAIEPPTRSRKARDAEKPYKSEWNKYVSDNYYTVANKLYKRNDNKVSPAPYVIDVLARKYKKDKPPREYRTRWNEYVSANFDAKSNKYPDLAPSEIIRKLRESYRKSNPEVVKKYKTDRKGHLGQPRPTRAKPPSAYAGAYTGGIRPKRRLSAYAGAYTGAAYTGGMRPKKRLSAWNVFVSQHSDDVRRKYPGISQAEVLSILGEMYRS